MIFRKDIYIICIVCLIQESSQFFSIDEETGVLRTKQVIDYEKVSEIFFE
jgi:hypothetical protein